MMSLNNLPAADDAADNKIPSSVNDTSGETPVKKGGKKNSIKGGKKPKKGENEVMSKSKLRKLLRNTGQEYVTKKGKVVKAKIFENKDCGCSKRCVTKIAVEDRQKCFDKFWKMGDFGKQNAYLSGLVTREAVKQHRPRLNCTNRGPKGVTYQYRVNVGRVSKQVCKKYFLQTFLVSDGRLSRALRKEENEKEPGEDLRGKKPPANKTSEEQLNRVRDHINEFPRYDAHYAINPKGKFLKSDLNVKKMYGMYVDLCKEKEIPFVKENIYRSVFNDEFSLSFLSPRRDPCHLLLNTTRKSPNSTPRKKMKPQINMEVEGLRPQPPPMPQHQKFQVAPQLFCPTDNLKCAYNHLSAPPTHMVQEKNTHYPQCEEAMTHNYFPQDHSKKEKAPGKKRVRNEMNHKTKLRKFLRNTGQEYITKKGKVVKAKVFEDKDCGCSKRCNSKITCEQRQKCFDKFWKMGDFSKQNAYLSGLVTREAVKQHRPRTNCKNRGPKGVTYQYRINVGRISRQVCKVYFLDTFVVSNGRLARALRKEENEREPGEDLRGKKTPANKTSEENLNRVRDHINSFPRFDIHYQQNPKGKFLKPDLNVKKMYGMYLLECQMKDVSYVKENIYRTVFNEEYNLTFLSPRKDPLLLLNPDRPKMQKPRKKNPSKALTIRPENNTLQTMPICPPDNTVPMRPPQRCNMPPQLFCPTDNAKCSYNAPITTTSLHQEKDTMYAPACQGMLGGGPPFYHQEQGPPSFHNQTPSFFNL
ncbi:hypothetical protein HNY73_017972 [Argiope bruennichi]|uniref:Uncharacterized protein n=1 Tax=Argiope bruennichi TaxID=94029 RepID=A0A8T0EFG4_ARGBR|nr:hypothetical protein HNY73_017972 [Argiope bruennichi]